MSQNAFQTAANYGNLPNGVFSPIIFSQKVWKQLRKETVVDAITNNDYFGEISQFGDSVQIVKEPDIMINDYARGAQVTPQDIIDEDFTLIIDRAKSFAFKEDDIEKKQTHINWMDLCSDRAAYNLRDAYDQDILGYAAGYELDKNKLWVARTAPVGTPSQRTADPDELLPQNKMDRTNFVSGAVAGTSVAVGTRGVRGTDFDASPLEVMNRAATRLNILNVPQDGRWVVISPEFQELLMDEDSKLVNNDYGGTGQHGEGLTNGQLVAGKIRGFKVYLSNNLPYFGEGPGVIAKQGSTTDYGVILFGHKSSVATASVIDKTERFRDPNSFADIVRGLQMYGRKIFRSEGLVRVLWNRAH